MLDTSTIAQAEAAQMPTTAFDVAQSCPEIDTCIKLLSDIEGELYPDRLDRMRWAYAYVQTMMECMEEIRDVNSTLREALYQAENVVSLKDLAIYELKDRIEELEEQCLE